MGRAQQLSKIGFTLAGRDALAEYGLMSTDDSITWVECTYALGDCGCMYLVKKEDDTETIVDNVKVSSLGKAIADYMSYPYDDSALLEAFDLMNDDEWAEVKEYIIKHNKQDLCRDKRWECYFDDILN